jgi:uncharacterized protein
MLKENTQPSEERFALPDILRGLAIAGIFINNIVAFCGLAFLPAEQKFAYPTGTLDKILLALQVIWVEGKFYSIFSLLFGIGFSIILSRYESKGGRPLVLFYRRVFVLAGFGLAHAIFLWEGDILLVYALLGMLLPLFRSCSNRVLLILAAALILSPILIDPFRLMLNFSPGEALFRKAQAMDRLNGIAKDPADYAKYLYLDSSGYPEVLKWNRSGFFYRWQYILDSNRLPKVLGMFLLGYAAGRSGIPAQPEEFRRMFRKLATWGFTLGIPFSIPMLYFEIDEHNVPKSWWGIADTVTYALSVVPLALAYASTVALAFVRTEGSTWLRVLAPAGRMALTLYIMQTILGILIFYNLGFGLGLRFGYTWVVVIALVVYAAQVAFAHLWFRYFRYGPLEWIWRMLTYGRILPIRKD